MDVDVDVVPMDEGRLDDGGGFRIIGLEIGQRLVGKDHAPAEGIVRPVALVDHDVQRRITQLQGDCEIQATRPGTCDGDTSDSAIRGHALSLK